MHIPVLVTNMRHLKGGEKLHCIALNVSMSLATSVKGLAYSTLLQHYYGWIVIMAYISPHTERINFKCSSM